MLRNYLVIAVRQLLRHKGYSAINIVGLAIGMACCIVILLYVQKEFTKLVLVANVIAWPIEYYAMNRWLQSFAYRIEMGWGTFILGGLLALVVALATVSAQAIKAAVANPVDALRYE